MVQGNGKPTNGEGERQRDPAKCHSPDGNPAQHNGAQPNPTDDEAPGGKPADRYKPDGDIADRDDASRHPRKTGLRVDSPSNVQNRQSEKLEVRSVFVSEPKAAVTYN
jgi:hypothetical protein